MNKFHIGNQALDLSRVPADRKRVRLLGLPTRIGLPLNSRQVALKRINWSKVKTQSDEVNVTEPAPHGLARRSTTYRNESTC